MKSEANKKKLELASARADVHKRAKQSASGRCAERESELSPTGVYYKSFKLIKNPSQDSHARVSYKT